MAVMKWNNAAATFLERTWTIQSSCGSVRQRPGHCNDVRRAA